MFEILLAFTVEAYIELREAPAETLQLNYTLGSLDQQLASLD